jgi:FkbM family methyltransferase
MKNPDQRETPGQHQPEQTFDVADAIKRAAEHCYAGRLGEAQALCHDALAAVPDSPAVLQLLSFISTRVSKRPLTRFFSQLGQDRYVFENYFKGKRDGVFVDIGAYDGETLSNTLFFERYLGWSGICIEPLPAAFQKLSSLRKVTCLNCCVSDYEGESDFLDVDVKIDEKMLSGLVENYDPRHVTRIDGVAHRKNIIKTKVTTLPAILRPRGIKKIDYCSIDTEGSELKILQSIDFKEFEISVLSIENNYGDANIRSTMEQNGYVLAGAFEGYDELYVKAGIQSIPQTTTICAVWHADPHRHRLLQGHTRNVRRQTRPVERIYVFDNDDDVPDDLDGKALVARDKLTIYEAWNLALGMVSTPYVMNLNLDDRLAPDAVSKMEQVLNGGADLVGGDWKICYTQEETDKPLPVYSANDLPFDEQWPPRVDTLTRLGSGTGVRATHGPACMWRMSLHGEFGRYPWKFADGTAVRTIGDTVWWRMLKQAGKKTVRMPLIIGNYYSHPHEQCEFRYPGTTELNLLGQVGINND